MKTTTNLTQRWLTRGLGLAAAGAFALISACGGGGSVGFDPAGGATSTPTPTPTTTPAPLPYAVLHSFASDKSEGSSSHATLLADGVGNFYGTTRSGGVNDDGTAFKITSTGTFTLLHSFGPAGEGIAPNGALVPDGAGNFYGTTTKGGANRSGTIYKMTKAGIVTTLYSFAGGVDDGAAPYSGLVADGAGNFYGTTYSGGTDGKGTVYKFKSADNTVTLLHSFAGNDGPGLFNARLVSDGAGNFYGTTTTGGASGMGSIYKITSTGVFTPLRSFVGGINDGWDPESELVADGAGNFYGTTKLGGLNGDGTIYKITSTGVFTLLYSFGTDGVTDTPRSPLLPDGSGNFYGTTGDGFNEEGTVYKFNSADNTVTVLHSFGAGNDGKYIYHAGLVADGAGNLYGTTVGGGAGNMGTVFRVPMQ